MNKEIELILTKLKIVSEEKENGAYICDKEHSKLLLSYIEQLEKENDRLKKDYSIIVNENCDNLLLEKKVEQLENNRDKAIEYIEWQKDNPQYDNVWRKYECEILINILKGDSDYE